jgi:hypothetical protein
VGWSGNSLDGLLIPLLRVGATPAPAPQVRKEDCTKSTCGDIDPVAEYVIAVDDYIADMDADAQNRRLRPDKTWY